MRIRVLASIILAVGLWAGAEEPRDLSELMTKGKLEADLGNSHQAAELFAAVAGAPNVPSALKWEALVRLGVARRAEGDHKGSVEAFEQVSRDNSNDPAALRFLVEAVAGVVPGRDRWNEIWTKVALTADTSDPARPALRVTWPGAPEAGGQRYTGQPVSLDFTDGNLQDIFRLFADITGLNVVVYPGVRGQVNLSKVTGMPWDQALERMLTPNGLGYRLEGKVLRIAKFEQLGESGTFSGKPIDLWFKGETLAEVFAYFARVSGHKIIVDPAVGGTMHFKLNDVPWDQALDLVVRVNDLRWTREGNVIRILPPARRQAHQVPGSGHQVPGPETPVGGADRRSGEPVRIGGAARPRPLHRNKLVLRERTGPRFRT